MKVVSVGDVSEQVRGVSYSKSESSSEPRHGYVAVLRANNITDEGLTFEDLVYVPVARVSAKQRIHPNDVVIAASSGSLSVVGKAAQARQAVDGSFGAFCKVLRPSDKVDPIYFGHFFRTPVYRRTVSGLAAGANINNLKNEHLDNLRIPLPPLPEQKRIAAILDAADALRAQRRDSIEQLDSLVQATFLEMFGDPVTNPKRWPQVELATLIAHDDRINYGVVQPGDDFPGGCPLIRVGDFADGALDTDNLKTIAPNIESRYVRSRLKGDELLVSCVGSIGTVCKVTTNERGFNIARAVARVPLMTGVNRDFVMHCLRSTAVQHHFAKETRTVSQPTLNIALIKTAPILTPPLSLQTRFASIVESIEQQKARLKAHLAELDNLFASLQSRAFKGELVA